MEHQEELLTAPVAIQALGQAPSDLIEDEPHQEFCVDDVGWRHDEIE